MKKLMLAALAGLSLSACAWSGAQCVQPDPVDPAHPMCWDKGVDCGTGIQQNTGAALTK